jgi:cytochrome c-type biogenesis protein CcmH/NrfG
LLITAACVPSVEDEGPVIEKGPARGIGEVEAEKPVQVSDMDLGGTGDPELDEIARDVLDARGAFIPGDEKSEDEWMSYRDTLSAKVKGSPTPFAYWLLAGVNNTLSEGSPEAQAAAKMSVTLAPSSSWAYDMLGFVLSSAGLEKEAQAAFGKALSFAGDGIRPPHVRAMAGGQDDDITGGGQDDDIMAGGQDDDITGGGQDDDILRSLGEGAFKGVRTSHLAPSPALVKKHGSVPIKPTALGLPGAEDAETVKLSQRVLTPQGYIMRPSNMKDRDWSDIAKALRNRLRKDPSAFKAWLAAGILLNDAEWGDTAKVGEALRAAQQAVELAPDSARAYCMLGIAYYFYKMPARAVNQLNKAVELDKNLAAPHFVLADIYARQKDYRRAKAELKAIMDLGKSGEPEYETAAQKLQLLDKPK